ncbi:MAG: asparagine synthase (glutamine-hydrolyzing), partial [Pseudomonadota bacterium]
MLRSLAHRGPDDEGEHRGSASAWLGHRRLAIIDPTPAGRQPMHAHNGRYSLVLNGELYNYRELRAGLEGFSPRTGTDTEIALELLATAGERGLARLRGMFALALWDEERGELLLARDRLGEKPLYYYHDAAAGRVLFASEVRTLLASGAVPRRLDSDGLDSYLTFGSVADPYTLIDGVRAVPAGGVVRFAADKLTVSHYWQLGDAAVDDTLSRDAAVEGLRAHLDTAQRRCLVADVPVGVLLSGGIDSSVNVALLAALGTPELRTFSVVFSGPRGGVSEAEYSALVAERFGSQHTTCTVALDDAQGLLSRAAASMDQPSHDGLNTYVISEA